MTRAPFHAQASDLDRHVWFQQVGQMKVAANSKPGQEPSGSRGRVPRISRLLALAIRYEQLLRSGHVRDYAELTQLGQVSSGRITQIMSLLLLAPEIQEAILFLPKTSAPIDPISERALRPIVAEPHWARQRELWSRLARARLETPPTCTSAE